MTVGHQVKEPAVLQLTPNRTGMKSIDIALLEKLTEAFENMIKGRIPTSEASYFENLANQAVTPELKQHIIAAGAIIQKYSESARFISNLSQGKLDDDPPKNNIFISPFKEMHSSLRHLVWQTKQVAAGDLNQKVSFMGDFLIPLIV